METKLDRRTVVAGAAAGAGLIGLSGAARAAVAAPVVDTTQGKIRGYADGRVNIFKGVPYGEPTGGANRFAAPKKRAPWPGIKDTVVYAGQSPQNVAPIPLLIEGSRSKEAMSEDCLYLNVWTPAVGGAANRPVMVWFHGGGYSGGSGAATWYDGTRLAGRHDAVVVTVNHRLNIFGFTYLAELGGARYADSGMAGMLDCVAALEWVRDNIGNFGGDAKNVTIFGESGGAGKVSTLMAMPPARGLFHRAVAESGAALRHMTPAAATESSRKLLATLGIAPNQIDRIHQVSDTALLAAMAKTQGAAFGPTVDGRSLPANPFDPGAPAVSANVPFMTGSNLTESTFLAVTPLDPIDEAGLQNFVRGYLKVDDAEARRLIALYRSDYPGRDPLWISQLISTDYWMRDQVITQATRKAALGPAPTYVYHFAWVTPSKLNCPHGTEIPFAFDNVDRAADLLGTGAARQPLADKMSAAWVAFARTGNPSIPGLAWPAYTAATRATMVFDNDTRVQMDPYPRQRVAIAELKARQA